MTCWNYEPISNMWEFCWYIDRYYIFYKYIFDKLIIVNILSHQSICLAPNKLGHLKIDWTTIYLQINILGGTVKLFKMKKKHTMQLLLRVRMDRHKISQYLQLLNALLHLRCLVSNTPGQTHMERWILEDTSEGALWRQDVNAHPSRIF